MGVQSGVGVASAQAPTLLAPHKASALITVTPAVGLPGEARPLILATAKLIAAIAIPLVAPASLSRATVPVAAARVAAVKVVVVVATITAIQAMGPIVGRTPTVRTITTLVRARAVAVPATAFA